MLLFKYPIDIYALKNLKNSMAHFLLSLFFYVQSRCLTKRFQCNKPVLNNTMEVLNKDGGHCCIRELKSTTSE
jgi:hypothetical protein